MAIIDQRLGSGDFDDGPSGGTGKILFFVAEAGSQEEAEGLALAHPAAPPVINGYLHDKITVSHQGGSLYFVDIEYRRSIPSRAPNQAGQSPAGQQTPGKDPSSSISRDLSFSTGGATKRIYKSLGTRHKRAASGILAPSFGGLIGVDSHAGKVEGCEVLAPTTDFTVTKRFPQLTVGWFRNMLSTVSSTNDAPYLGLDRGEVLFKGGDGQFKDDDRQGFPWTVTGRFGFSANKTSVLNPEELFLDGIDGQIEIPEVRGWDYVWVVYAKAERADSAGTPFVVQLPKYAYCEIVYPERDMTKLNLE